jgi:hypothetical protein
MGINVISLGFLQGLNEAVEFELLSKLYYKDLYSL